MIPGQVHVQLDEKAIRNYIQQQIDQQIHDTLLMVDLEKLVVITSMSKRFLEDEILSDPRMRLIERRKARKRWWLYKPAIEVIQEITENW
ncbi:hypothetical protein [Paenisporosarcina sp. OV554]|uniref:hypothetical protein n=1 Tax=Paenisporosarcina sp. OV554 TaxID=2135694 RepID=UPI000D36A473|nr:hypothetical protein [Paenisporosarcina sp. OV554]PUB12225.1 hypothetical protein C8K15_11030 [Paenisporosarcina sp. OV554]